MLVEPRTKTQHWLIPSKQDRIGSNRVVYLLVQLPSSGQDLLEELNFDSINILQKRLHPARADSMTSDTMRVVSHPPRPGCYYTGLHSVIVFPIFVSSMFSSPLFLWKQKRCHRAALGGNATETKTVFRKYTGVWLQSEV